MTRSNGQWDYRNCIFCNRTFACKHGEGNPLAEVRKHYKTCKEKNKPGIFSHRSWVGKAHKIATTK